MMFASRWESVIESSLTTPFDQLRSEVQSSLESEAKPKSHLASRQTRFATATSNNSCGVLERERLSVENQQRP